MKNMNNIYVELMNHFSKISGVELPGAKGAQGLKYEGRMFAMFYKGNLTVKLPEGRVRTLIETGEGLPHDPGTGVPMRDRVLIPVSRKDLWIPLCEESLGFVRG